MVRIRVDSHNAFDLYTKPGFFFNLSLSCIMEAFPEILRATRQSPKSVISPLDEQYTAFAVTEYNGNCNDQGVSPWRRRVVQVVSFRHDALPLAVGRIPDSLEAVRVGVKESVCRFLS